MKVQVKAIARSGAYVRKSDINKMLKREYRKVGVTWHRKFRRPHFTLAAVSRYGYARRKPGYNKHKRRTKGHTIPLVFTGESRRRSEQKTIHATRKGVDIKMPTNALNFRNPHSNVNMRQEFTTVSTEEQNTLEKQMQNGLQRRLNRYDRPKKL